MARKLKLVGGHPALDFLNTVAWRRSSSPEERLHSFSDWVAWARRAGLIDVSTRRALEAAGAKDPRAAERVPRELRERRELAYRLVEPLLAGGEPAAEDLIEVNRLERRAHRATSIAWAGKEFVRRRGTDAGSPGELVDRVFQPVLELLLSPDLRRIAQCQDDRGCGWVFLSRSRSNARRWCSMEECGNRAKSRRHYERGARR